MYKEKGWAYGPPFPSTGRERKALIRLSACSLSYGTQFLTRLQHCVYTLRYDTETLSEAVASVTLVNTAKILAAGDQIKSDVPPPLE